MVESHSVHAENPSTSTHRVQRNTQASGFQRLQRAKHSSRLSDGILQHNSQMVHSSSAASLGEPRLLLNIWSNDCQKSHR
ncbi:uncharacterized protein RAG0_11641 [Rhynchosporium agropyri]|uniref:Uncharacterized protein n=2 Tax=Rhynchosporium TaxID=38037 RepID=A0A1E1L578_9HELO|nr:uncharacterized protein RCO7_14512 [Rhynchosporium commune]CZT05659.1 uncharacterized protein RAG0_11641 [Rhynchosporium agropyri]